MSDLRPYQQESRDVICDEWARGTNRVLIQMATGTGKTRVFSTLPRYERMVALLDRFPKRRGARMLVLAHRTELITQALHTLQRLNPGLMVSVEQADRFANTYSDVIVGSIDTLAARSYARTERLMAKHGHFPIVLVDEAHHSTATKYRGILTRLGFLPASSVGDAMDYDDAGQMDRALAEWDKVSPKDRLLIGVTATPNRSDGVGLSAVYQTLAYTYPLPRAIAEGYLVPIVPWCVESVENLDGVKSTGARDERDFNTAQLQKAVDTERRNWLALKAWQEYAAGRPTIAFCTGVAHAYHVAELFRTQHVKALAIHGDMPAEDRAIALRQYREGTAEFIANCEILTEGTDLPHTSCILALRPTESPTLYEQLVGRGLRPDPSDPVGAERFTVAPAKLRKPDCVVIDVVDVTKKHTLMASPILYGLPPSMKTDGEQLQELSRDVEHFLEEHPGVNLENLGRFSLKDLRMRAKRMQLFTPPPATGPWANRLLSWIRVSADDYRIQYQWADGIEVVKVGRDLLGKYDVSATIRPGNGQPVRQRTIGAQILDAGDAAALAEKYIALERPSIMKLRRRDAPYYRQPATRNQIAYMKARGIEFPPKCTGGEASERISRWQAMKGR
jgi:superfamily II DNA or RNA helicase